MKDIHGGRNVDESRFPSDTRRRRLRPWLRALAGTCLAATMVGGPAIVAGGTAAGAHALIGAPAPNGRCPAKTARPEFRLDAAARGTHVQLTWGPAASGPLEIYEGTTDDICQAVKVHLCAVTNESALAANLTSGTTYYFWLVDEESNVVSNVARAIPKAKLGAPAGLAAEPGNGQVTLSWAAPAPPSPLYDHKVYWGNTADFTGSAPVAEVAGTSTSYTVTGLVNGTTYCFWVTVVSGDEVDGVDEGLAAEVSAVPGIVPEAPTGLVAVPGNGQVTLSWAAPASDGGSPVSGYNVYQGTSAGGETGTPVNGSPVTATSYTVTGLVNGITYYFKVTAVNGVGEGPGAEVKAVPVTVPDAPAGLVAVAGNGQVTLSWAAPASDGGSPVTGYDLYEGTTADFHGSAPLAKVAGTAVTVTGLVNGTTYYFKVTAVNGAGEGPGAEGRSGDRAGRARWAGRGPGQRPGD